MGARVMRLINTKTHQFEVFHGNTPKYAILSHTWRDQEVVYGDFEYHATRDDAYHKRGYEKIEYLCSQATIGGINYAWIDTACIDKTSSAELSEAINSMFAWYRDAEVCYDYLDDVFQRSDIPSSRWITRGWTLQELIAPKKVEFYNKDWSYMGSKYDMASDLSSWTMVEQDLLKDRYVLEAYSIATRMSWASRRKTSREEDIAYCLLGIFNVAMPLMYGEGEKAFIRLQEEILKESPDDSILAWTRQGGHYERDGYLAPHPSYFKHQRRIVWLGDDSDRHEFSKTGLKLTLPMIDWRDTQIRPGETTKTCLAILNCRFENSMSSLVGLPVFQRNPNSSTTSDKWRVSWFIDPSVVTLEDAAQATMRTIILRPNAAPSIFQGIPTRPIQFRRIFSMDASALRTQGFEMVSREFRQDPRNFLWESHTPSLSTSLAEVTTRQTRIFRQYGFHHPIYQEAFTISIFDRIGERERSACFSCHAKTNFDDAVPWLKDIGDRQLRESRDLEDSQLQGHGYSPMAFENFDDKIERVVKLRRQTPFSAVKVIMEYRMVLACKVLALTLVGVKGRASTT